MSPRREWSRGRAQEGSTIECTQERTETHCLAGHIIGLEPVNPGESQLIGFACQLGLAQAQLGWRRPFACEPRNPILQLQPRFQRSIFSANGEQRLARSRLPELGSAHA